VKAQNKSLQIFAGEAYNVEQGSRTRCSGTSARRPPDASSIPRRKITPTSSIPTTAPPWERPRRCPATRDFALFMRLAAHDPAPSQPPRRTVRPYSTASAACNATRASDTDDSPFTGMAKVTYPSVLGFCAASSWARGLATASQGVAIAENFDCAAVGSGTATVLPARWSDLRPRRGHPTHSDKNNTFASMRRPSRISFQRFRVSTVFRKPESAVRGQYVIDNFNALSASQQTDVLTSSVPSDSGSLSNERIKPPGGLQLKVGCGKPQTSGRKRRKKKKFFGF